MNVYQNADLSHWQGRHDGPGAERLHEVIRGVDLRSDPLLPNSVVFLGFASDEGVRRNEGRLGAAEGPIAWRRALANYPVPSLCHEQAFYDGGDIICIGGDLEEAQATFARLSSAAVRQKALSCACGGGHEIAWGHFMALAAAGGASDLGIINIDAHYDLRPLQEGNRGSSGTSFTQMAAYQEKCGYPFRYLAIGIQENGNTEALHREASRLGCQIIPAKSLHTEELTKVLPKLEAFIAMSKNLYLTICLDVFAAPYASGVSAPQPLGVTPWQILPLLQLIAQSGKLLAFDIAELSPPLDHEGMTARLAAALTVEILAAQGLLWQ